MGEIHKRKMTKKQLDIVIEGKKYFAKEKKEMGKKKRHGYFLGKDIVLNNEVYHVNLVIFKK